MCEIWCIRFKTKILYLIVSHVTLKCFYISLMISYSSVLPCICFFSIDSINFVTFLIWNVHSVPLGNFPQRVVCCSVIIIPSWRLKNFSWKQIITVFSLIMHKSRNTVIWQLATDKIAVYRYRYFTYSSSANFKTFNVNP